MRRSLIGFITLLVIALVLLPTDTNIAASVLPGAWKPYLWLAWPAEVLLAGTLIYGEMRDRRERQLQPRDADEYRKRLSRAGNDLAQAVRRQWTAEAGLRSLRSPEPMRARWRSISRPAGKDISQVLAKDWVPGRPSQVRGDIRHVLEVFRNVRARQLVILGEPAAGKSVMALSLTLGLLPDGPRDLLPDEQVPVLVTASSWNPHKEHLHSWLARRIVEEYPALANADVYGPDATARLITSGRLVPVLDGLDEMSAALQPAAIRAIDQAITDRYPIVVTCRSAEYYRAVEANGRLLPHAAVLEIQPLGIDDATEFLCGADPRPERWQRVLDSMRTDPDGPLGQALRSPLMVDLARTIYATTGGDPAELLNTGRFPSRADVERHLLGAFLLLAYEERPGPPSSRLRPALPRYPAGKADRWLRFLARNQNAPDSGDPGTPGTGLAWWQLFYSARRSTRGVLAGLVAGLVSGLAMGFSLGPVVGLAYALTFGPAAGFTYSYGRPRRPSRVQVRFRGHGWSLLRRLATSLAVGLVTGHPISGAVVLAVLAAQLWWTDTPTGTATASSPMTLLRQDRRATLVLGGVLCLVISLAAAVGFMAGTADFPVALGGGTAAVVIAVCSGAVISAIIGAVLGGALIGRAGSIAFGVASGAVSVPIAVSATVLGVSYDKIMPPHPGLAAGISFGLIIGWMAIMCRSWGAFLPARAWLALRGDLPWRLMRFLDDAHRRGVLRQAGTVYQFRHERLRDYLAAAGGVGLVAAGESMRLLDRPGTHPGKYNVTVQNSSGVQVGDGNTLTGVNTGGDAYAAGRDLIKQAAVSHPGEREAPGSTEDSGRPGAAGGKDHGRGSPGGWERPAEEEPRPRFLTGSLPERAPAGARISLLVQVTLTAQGVSPALRAFPVSPGGTVVTITVSASGLITGGDLEQDLIVPFDKDSDPVRFGFRTGPAGRHAVQVQAYAGGTYLGELALEISVEAGAALEQGGSRTVPLPDLAAEPGEVTLQVSRTSGGGYSFQLLSGTLYRADIIDRLAGDPAGVTGQMIAELRAMSNGAARYATPALARRRLRSLGSQLWGDVVPASIREQFWAQRDKIRLFTIASDMDTVPWELLYPVDPGNDSGFLVEQFPVVRRVYGQDRARVLRLDKGAGFIVPPKPPANALDEVAAIRTAFPGNVPDRGTKADLAAVLELLDAGAVPSVLHFAGHNTFTDETGSLITLDGGPLRPSDLSYARQQRAFEPARPLVFLNGCRTAGEIPGFTQMIGWASEFMGAGAGAFIGTLWAVRSDAARMFAAEFYRALVHGGETLGAASLLARRSIASDQGDPTWLAYTVYGNPAACVAHDPMATRSNL